MRKRKEFGPFTIFPDRGRTKDEFMGRFGGGWQYKLGVTAGSMRKGQMTILVGLWVREFRVTYRTKSRRLEDAREEAMK